MKTLRGTPSGVVYADNIITQFFDVLVCHGGKYEKKYVEKQELLFSLKIGDKTLFQFLRDIFEDKIPVDCSLYIQVVLQKDCKNCVVSFGIGVTAEVIIEECNDRKLPVSYFHPNDPIIASELMYSSCNSKGQWVIAGGNRGLMTGMTEDGPVTKSLEEWKSYLRTQVRLWLDNKRCCRDSTFRGLKDKLTCVNVEIILRDTGLTTIEFVERPVFNPFE